MNRVLVIAPHADDEVLGCGGTIAKYTNSGFEVRVVIATNASMGAPELYQPEDIAIVRQEALEAHNILGVSKSYFLDFPAPKLDSFPSYQIALKFSKIFDDFEPNILFIPHPGDLHLDHNVIYRSALVSARPQGNRIIDKIYCYETLSETNWAPFQGDNQFKPNLFINISNYFHLKIKAMECFKSQLKVFPHIRSLKSLKALSELRGSNVSFEKAEAFAIEREIVN